VVALSFSSDVYSKILGPALHQVGAELRTVRQMQPIEMTVRFAKPVSCDVRVHVTVVFDLLGKRQFTARRLQENLSRPQRGL